MRAGRSHDRRPPCTSARRRRTSRSPRPGRGLTAFPLPPTASGPLRILLVEDSRADAELLVAMLEDELPDAVVSVSATVAEAVPLLAGPLDVAITDLALPDAQGLEALTAIRAARPDIAVVVLTGRQDHQLALQALSAGAEDYLVKGAHDARGVATAVLYAAQRRSAEQEARRYERLALSLLDAMESSTCAVDATGRIIAVNRAWRDFALSNGGDDALTGVGADYLAVCASAVGGDAEVAASVAAGLRGVLSGELPRFERDYACHSPSQERWLSVRMNPLPETGAVVSHVDMSSAKRAEQALSHLSLHDALTDLPNRALLHDRLVQALRWSERGDSGVVVAFLDLDQFKKVNDSLGHAAGDELLQQVAGRLSRSMRAGDTLSRISGDEFVVVAPGIDDAEQTQLLVDRLAGCFDAPFVLGSASLVVTVSTGLVRGRSSQSAEELLLAADAAMYDAKSSGRGRTRMWSDELRRDAEDRLQTEADLRVALERGELVLHYQPVVDLRRGQVVGVEALLRWEHPDGLRLPASFLPQAEATGLIVPIGALVLEQACGQAAAWAADGLDLTMAVNFSARQISHPDVVAEIESALEVSGLLPGKLLAEVTETTLMEDAQIAEVVLQRIAELGVGVAVDDFGTGYSSLVHLKRYPLSALKVDGSFVAGLAVRSDDDAIVASVVGLARAVGASCTAEGVETVEQHAALRALDCDLAQGHLFSRPVPAADLPAAVRRCHEVLSRPVPPSAAAPPRRDWPVAPDVLRRMHEMRAEGRSLHTIAAALNAEGSTNPDGRRWHSTSVARTIPVPPRPRAAPP